MGLRAAALIYLLLLVDKADSEKGFKCGGILSASSGNISSPNFPSRYPYNSDCSWLIVVAEGSSVHLTFHHFELEHHASCSYDYIKIYNGVAEDEGNLLGAFCGDVSPPQFTSSWNVMSIIFHSDRHVAYRGFSVGYRKGAHRGLYLNDLQHVTRGGAWLDLNNNGWVCGKHKKTQLQVALNINMCGGVLTGLSGEISSPGYPLEYNNNADCTWTIRVSNASLVTLVFLDFQLENNEGCNFDFVALFDGPTVTHRHLGNYCGADKPPRVVTTSNNLLVAFKSDFNIGGRGFKAYYYSGECQQVLVAVSGTFSSPRFPNIYPNNINCHWGITQASGYRVKLFFPFLDLEERNSLSGECDYDSVTVYDGDSQADPMLGRWCGGERPPSLVSRGNKLLVVLSTDRNEAHRGFTAAYLGVVPVNVSCTRSEFTILIPQQSLPRLDRESIYLGNPTCTAQLTSTAYKILAQFVNCGTAGQVTKFILSDVLLLLRDLPIHLQKHQNITVLVNKLYIDFSDGKQQNVQEYKVQCDALRKVASVSIISEEERRLEEQAQQSERGTEGAAGDPQAEPHDLSDIVFISICVLAVILMMIAIVWLVLL